MNPDVETKDFQVYAHRPAKSRLRWFLPLALSGSLCALCGSLAFAGTIAFRNGSSGDSQSAEVVSSPTAARTEAVATATRAAAAATPTGQPQASATTPPAATPAPAGPTATRVAAAPTAAPLKDLYGRGETARSGGVAFTVDEHKLTLGTVLRPTARVDVWATIANEGAAVLNVRLTPSSFIGEVRGDSTGAASVDPGSITLDPGAKVGIQIVFQVRGNPVQFRDVREADMTVPVIGGLPSTHWRLRIR